MPRHEGTFALLLLDSGVAAPNWVEPSTCVTVLRAPEEPRELFVERGCALLDHNPGIREAIVAPNLDNIATEATLLQLGTRLINALSGRAKARLIFCIPAETKGRTRRLLLSLAATLASCKCELGTVVVGAHFSAKSPESAGKLKLLSELAPNK